eukprot:CAMPEP_0115500534 /NCGR_PEP_ID=MMETSP0271-20121206/67919_1 /TAXON_ID=71861 /ORGANISM="Scrippsiella trochoidea, Strain CCMP3099" /LENGTH=35 /DNA_ID= /DNA_START= /DNA_END= /DNA_ORIENTATION=
MDIGTALDTVGDMPRIDHPTMNKTQMLEDTAHIKV